MSSTSCSTMAETLSGGHRCRGAGPGVTPGHASRASQVIERRHGYALALVTAPRRQRARRARPRRWCGPASRGRRDRWLATAVVGLPLIVAAVALARRDQWHPVLDLAMTEFRVRDVFTPPHAADRSARTDRRRTRPRAAIPGPLSFYLLAPTYRLLGSSSWSLEVGDGRHPPRRHRHRPVARPPPARLEGRRRRRRPVRPRPARLRPGAADPAVEPVPARRGVGGRAARHVGRAVRRPPMPRPARRRRDVLRPDPRAVPAARRRDGRARAGATVVLADRARRAAGRGAAGAASACGPSASVSCCGCRRSPTSCRNSPGNIRRCSTTSARRPSRPSGSARASRIALRHLDAIVRDQRPARRHRPVRRRASASRGGVVTLAVWAVAAVRRLAHRLAGAASRCTSSSASPCCSAPSRRPASSGGPGTT